MSRGLVEKWTHRAPIPLWTHPFRSTMMTKAELLKALKDFPDDTLVFYTDHTYGPLLVNHVVLEEIELFSESPVIMIEHLVT